MNTVVLLIGTYSQCMTYANHRALLVSEWRHITDVGRLHGYYGVEVVYVGTNWRDAYGVNAQQIADEVISMTRTGAAKTVSMTMDEADQVASRYAASHHHSWATTSSGTYVYPTPPSWRPDYEPVEGEEMAEALLSIRDSAQRNHEDHGGPA